MGIGGGPEGVLAASALDAFDCFFQGRFIFDNENNVNRAKKMGIDDFVQAGMDGETAAETMAYVDTLKARIGEVRKKDKAIKDFAKEEKVKEKAKAKLELFYK